MLMTFFTIIAWVAIAFTLITIPLKVYAAANYDGSILQLQDAVRGHQRQWDISKDIIVLVLAIIWLVAKHLS